MTKLKDTLQSVEVLKELVEILYTTPEDKLIDVYDQFEFFKNELSSLLSTITRYRIEINSSDETRLTFGPKTRQTVQSLVYNYDKLYELYEEHLCPRFLPIEPLYREKTKIVSVPSEPEKSIEEQTRIELEQINIAKEKMKQNAVMAVDFSEIKDQDTDVDSVISRLEEVYKNHSAEDLEGVLESIHREHPEDFIKIVENINALLSEIAKRPDELNLRILRIKNLKLQEDFLQYTHSVVLLKHAKFRIVHSLEIQDQLKQVNCGEENDFFLYMHEPDMFTFYNRWKAWLDSLTQTSNILLKFLRSYRSLLRSGATDVIKQAFLAASQ
ncbi:conserved hypothetical protein [Theileria equi strain WA]|uniref:Uncharacterized protein n=1 Tax=Theileria equi strain WA TaxID=1537102 RepID=L1L954_THEEQ|nr:conserved hypothetical protein [Theileria equi strain WA]EKX72036.1 conserved hypothetical protein [Theileria equi strain WA]|eukprot:XP_004831488.1 conserved hypothetical protein [Theileria equi strain WA]